MKNIVISVLSAGFLLMGTSGARAQGVLLAQARTLETGWTDGAGFANYAWLRTEDEGELYASAVYLSLSGNSLSIYNTYNAAPLGQLARCGGLGCDLGKGQLLATLEVVPQGNNRYTVTSASQKASFLQGAQCRVVEDYMQVFECFASSGPMADLPSTFRFSPGT